MPVIGERPRPRALFLGFEAKEIEPFKEFFPTTQVIDSLDEVREAEWDVLVSRNAFVWPEPHLYVLSFGENGRVSDIEYADLPRHAQLAAGTYDDTRLPATEYVIPDDLPPDLSALVMNDLVPRLNKEQRHDCLGVGLLVVDTLNHKSWQFHHAHKVDKVQFQLFIGSTEPTAFAGRFKRNGTVAEAWLLPFSDLNVGAWIQAALKQWHNLEPERFPVDSGWERAAAWMTPMEAALVRRIDALCQERREVLARLDSAEAELMAQLQAASVFADENERLLLTAQGNSLVNAVAKAFEELGFKVQNMDEVFPATDRREDLRIRLPEQGEWTAICEVKGYRNGAAVNDLLKMERFRARFYRDTGRDPERCWYVVNSFMKDDPARRPRTLATNPAEVETFAEGGGLVVGTVELFRLLMDVRSGKVGAHDARRLLMDQTGTFSLKLGGQQPRKSD
jgi:hypothetical protein